MIKKTIIKVIPAALLVALSAFLLRGDVWTFWTWYLLAAVLGVVGMAVTGRLFRGFADKGWMFSKVVSITITGFLTWFLVSIKLLKFTTVTCVGITVVFGIVCILLYRTNSRKAGYDCLPDGQSGSGLSGRNSVFCSLSDVDLSGRISSGGTWNREVHGLWIHGSHDAEQDTSGNRSSGIPRARSTTTTAVSILPYS